MKKKLFAILALLLAVIVFTSCSTGVSVPYYILAMDNYTENVFDVYSGYKETITYYKDGEKELEYSVYVDKGSIKTGDKYSSVYYYNVCESYEDYTFYAYDQELFVVTGEKTYSVILADKSTYLEYVKDYGERAHILDLGSKYQKYSKNLDSGVEVEYYSKVTPLIAAELYLFDVKETDKIISKYTLMENTDFYISIEYSIESSDGSREKIAERKFEYYETREENEHIFASLPSYDETVTVSLVNEKGVVDTYKVPKGVYVGIDAGKSGLEFFMDEARTIPFEAGNVIASDNVKIYTKNN
jgi:hypothetical protein